MKSSTALLCRNGLRKSAYVALPLLLGAAVFQSSQPVFGDNPPALSFAEPRFADVIEAAQPAVVKIEVKKSIDGIEQLQGQAGPFGEGSPFERFQGRSRNGDPRGFGPGPREQVEGLGSGFIIDAKGYIVTNNHVIDGAEEITVTLADGRNLPAKLVGADPLTDLALLEVKTEQPLPTIAFGDSERARVGDWVVAIGSPFGLGGSVTAGIISARGRDIHSGPYDDYLQIDAPINSGNSGGPVLGADGKVLGVNTAIFSPTGGNIGIGFAIPARDAVHVINELREHGAVKRGWLGVQIQPITQDIATAFKADNTHGALVAEVVDLGPAKRAGIMAGDIITAIGDTPIKEARDLSRAVGRMEPGSKVELAVLRNGQARQVATQIDRHPGQTLAFSDPAGRDTTDHEDALGLALGALSDEARQRLNLDQDVKGALVVGVKSGGIADTSGMQPGDIIVRVNQDEVTDAGAAQAALIDARSDKRPVVVLVRRGDEQFFMTMKIA